MFGNYTTFIDLWFLWVILPYNAAITLIFHHKANANPSHFWAGALRSKISGIQYPIRTGNIPVVAYKACLFHWFLLFFKVTLSLKVVFSLYFICGDWKVARYFFSTLYTILILTTVHALVFADYHLSDNKKKIGQQCKFGLKNSWKMCVNFAWWLEILMLEI